MFFTASHVLVSLSVGYGIALVAAYLATHYQAFRKTALLVAFVAVDLALYSLAVETYSLFGERTVAGTNPFMNGLVKFSYLTLAVTCLVLAMFQFLRPAPEGRSQIKPSLALAGVGFLALLIASVLFFNLSPIS